MYINIYLFMYNSMFLIEYNFVDCPLVDVICYIHIYMFYFYAVGISPLNIFYIYK